MAIKDDINSYFSDTFSNLDISDTDLSKWTKQGYRDLSGKLPGNMLDKIKQSTSLTSSSYPLDGDKFLYALRNDYKCRYVSSAKKGQLTSQVSPYYASEIDPACYVENSTVYIVPSPTTDKQATIYYISIPSISITSDTTVGNLPEEMSQFPVMYAAYCGKDYLASQVISDIGSIESSITNLLDNFNTQFTGISINVTDALNGTETTLSSYLNLGQTITFDDLTGTAIDIPSISSISRSLSDSISNITVDIDSDFSVDETNVNAPSSFSFSSDITSFDIDFTSGDFDKEHSNEDIEKAQQTLQSYQTQIEEQSAKIQEELKAHQEDLQAYQTELEKAAQKYSSELENDIQRYQTLINETINKYQAETQGISSENQAELNRYQSQINRAINAFQAEKQNDVQRFQTKIQSYLNEKQSDLQRLSNYLEEANSRMQLLQSKYNKVKTYRNEANSLYKRYDKELKEYLGIQRGEE